MANSETRRIKVGLIGAGSMASTFHYPSLASFPDVEIAAICDLVPEKAEQAAQRFGIPRTYTDYQRMLDEVDPEAVWVIMPPQYLFDPASAVLERGKHLFIEKPLALTTVQARMLAYLAEKNNCLTMVGFQRRHVPAITDLRRRVEERGPIHHAALTFIKATPDLTAPAGIYGGSSDPLWCDGAHAVDALRWLCGGEAVEVHATVRTRYVPGPIPNEYNALIAFSTGAVGILQFSYMTGRRIFRAEFHGKNITAYIDPDADSYLVSDYGKPEPRSSREWGTAGGAKGDSQEHWLGFWHENRHFVDCLHSGQQPTSHFADAVKTMELCERIMQAGLRS